MVRDMEGSRRRRDIAGTKWSLVSDSLLFQVTDSDKEEENLKPPQEAKHSLSGAQHKMTAAPASRQSRLLPP